jgi:hypothetical protein
MLSQFSGAVMDAERKHRFLLWRFWDDRPRMLFIGLNPSTANELTDDPTIRRLCDFARSWGYGGLYACNLYSQVTPYPEDLKDNNDFFDANVHARKMTVELSSLVVCGWGDGVKKIEFGDARASAIKWDIQKPMCFGLTKSGNPKHPVRLSKETNLMNYE